MNICKWVGCVCVIGIAGSGIYGIWSGDLRATVTAVIVFITANFIAMMIDLA